MIWCAAEFRANRRHSGKLGGWSGSGDAAALHRIGDDHIRFSLWRPWGQMPSIFCAVLMQSDIVT
jgi:hypothetical protein